jgi:RNA polymerase sigma factor (sigma-70 family)
VVQSPSYQERVASEVPKLVKAQYGRQVATLEKRFRITIEDFIADVQARALRYESKFDTSRSVFSTWINLLAKTEFCNHLRKVHRERNLFDKKSYKPPHTNSVTFPTIEESSPESVDTAEMFAKVQELIRKQPIQRQEMLEMYFVQGMTYQQIGDAKGCRKSNVFKHINDAVEEIREQLNIGE